MTKEEGDALIKTECARLGRPMARTKADLRALLLIVIAEREGKDVPQAIEPAKKPVGRPLGLNSLDALHLSHSVSRLREEGKERNDTEACTAIREGLKREMQRDIGSSHTLRTKISKLRNQRSKLIKDEKFRAKLLSELEHTCWAVFDFVATHFEPSEQNLAAVLLTSICFDVVNEYLGEDASEAIAERILCILNSVEKEPV